MLKTLARFALLRFLPRRILPIVTVVEAILFLRSIRNRSRVRVDAPPVARTASPGMASPGTEPPGTEPPGTEPSRPNPTERTIRP